MLLSEMASEMPEEFGPPNWAKVVRKVTDCIDQGVVFVYEEDGEIYGSLGGEIGKQWFTEAQMFGDLWFYVRKDKRTSKAAVSLLKAIKDWGHEHNIPLQVGHMFGGEVDRKDVLYERCGFKRLGAVYSEGAS